MIKNEVTQQPRVYYARHMQPGIAKYADETILVDTHGMKNLISSVKDLSIPVYVEHQDVKLDTLKQDAAGYVTESFYNALDGWAWFKFVAVDDEAHAAIKKGWSVSNAYKPAQWDKSGTKNNCSYDRELKAGEFTHLAIVPNPRYEEACILTPDEFKSYQADQEKKAQHVTNSNPKGSKMLNIFKMKKEEVSTIDADTMVELTNGKSVSIAEMIKTVENSTKTEPTVLINGKEVALSEVKKLYENAAKKSKKNKKNESEEMDDCENESEETEEEDDCKDGDKFDSKKNKKNKKNEKKNGDDEDAEDEEKETAKAETEKKNKAKKNAKEETSEVPESLGEKFFNELRNANLKIENESDEQVEVPQTQLQRGQSKYGSAK